MAALHAELKGKQAAFTWAAGEVPQLPLELPPLLNALQSIFEAAYAPAPPTATTVPNNELAGCAWRQNTDSKGSTLAIVENRT